MKFFKPLLLASASSAFAVDVTEFGAVDEWVEIARSDFPNATDKSETE